MHELRSMKACGPPAAAALMMSSWAAAAWAQADPPAPQPSPEELAEIQRALGADAKAAPAPPAAPEPPAAVSRAVGPLNPRISFIADFALAVFSDEDPLQAGGHDPAANGFNLMGLEIAAGADVDPYFELDTNLVFGPEGFELEEAYATTLALPASLQARAGQFFTRFGRHNQLHLHRWEFADAPLVLGKMLGPDGNRGLGVEVSWLSPLPWYLELVVSETMATGECCARSFYADDDRGVHGVQDLQTTAALKQFHAISDDWSLATGLSFAIGPNASDEDAESYLLGGDLYLKYRPISRESSTVVSLQAEGITRRRETPGGTLVDTGLYGQLLWRFARRWSIAGRYDFVTGTEGDPIDPEHTAERHRGAASLTFHPTEFSRLRLQGSADMPAWRPAPIYAGFLALEVAIGPHGAHTF